MLKSQSFGSALLVFFASSMPAFAEGNFTDNPEAEKYYCKGTPLLQAYRYKEAIPYLEAATRVDKHYVAAFINLAICYDHVGDFQQALRSASSALAYNNQSSYAFREKARAEYHLRMYKEAIYDLTMQMQYENPSASSYYQRGVCYFCSKDLEHAIGDFKQIVHAADWRDSYTSYAGISLILTYRKEHKEADAKFLLEHCQKNMNPQIWPAPVVNYLARKINSAELLKTAKTIDEITEARTYLGVDLLNQGKKKEAIENLQWVIKYGNKSFLEYQIATTELENLKGVNIIKTTKKN